MCVVLHVHACTSCLFFSDVSWCFFIMIFYYRFDKHEYGIGQLFHLSTIYCPALAKAWWQLAGWCYRIGRKNLEALSSTGTAELLQHEQKEVDKILGPVHVCNIIVVHVVCLCSYHNFYTNCSWSLLRKGLVY